MHNTSACKVTKTEHMNDVEIAQSHEIGDHLGGKEFVGQPQKDTPGIDGWLDGVPTSLKEYTGTSGSGVLRHATKAEQQLKNASYSNALLYIRAENMDHAKLLDFARGGPIEAISRQGVVKEIHIKTKTGWIRCLAGVCS